MNEWIKQFLLIILDWLPPKNPYKEWEKRIKRSDQLHPNERKEWVEEQEQMWRDYYDSLL